MSLRVVPLASLLIYAGFSTAAITAPSGCIPAVPDWWWNTMGQNVCIVAAYLLSTCSSGGSFTIDPLPPGGHYTGPKADQKDDLCYCNTVTYSLLSACDYCQNAPWLGYTKFTSNCTKVLTPKTFPNPVPDGTRVPAWALIDVTVKGTWDFNASATAGLMPEVGPGMKIGG